MNTEKKYKNLLIVSILLLALVIILGGYVIYNELNNTNEIKEEKKEPSKEETQPVKDESKTKTFVFTTGNDIYVMTSSGNLEKISSNYIGAPAKRLFSIDNNTLYYVAKDNLLHSISLETNEDKNHNIEINPVINGITVVGNILITQYQENFAPKADLYDITTREKSPSTIKSNNVSVHVYNNYFCYSSDALYCYDTNTQKIETIENSSYIIGSYKSKIIYKETSQSNQNLVTDYIYDLITKTKTPIQTYRQVMFSNYDHMVIANNVVYFVQNKKLKKYDDSTTTELLDLNPDKYLSTEYKLYKINENKLLIKEACDPIDYGFSETTASTSCATEKTRYYYYDTKTGKLELATTDYSLLDYILTIVYNN